MEAGVHVFESRTKPNFFQACKVERRLGFSATCDFSNLEPPLDFQQKQSILRAQMTTLVFFGTLRVTAYYATS